MAELRFDFKELIEGLDVTETKLDIAVGMLAETNAKNLEKDAKEQARWTDRTGRARTSLSGFAYRRPSGQGWRIVLAHGVDYGIWLELANEKRYAIVNPLMDIAAAFILEDFQGLMDRIN